MRMMTMSKECEIMTEDDDGYWTPIIDHSQDIEIRKTKDGKLFALKNIRQEFDGDKIIFKADMSGDVDGAMDYLTQLAERIQKLTLKDNSTTHQYR